MKRAIILTILAGVFLFAGDWGKISGRVVDGETKQPMFSANVAIEGTTLGAVTDEKGEFSILYVPAGTYAVVASYVSYYNYTYTLVVVNADQTTALNFQLKPTIIEIPGVQVTASHEVTVVMDVTHTGHSFTSEEMNRLPITNINQIITLQPGVVQSNLGTHIRGGRNEEITYVVDGMVSKVPQTGALPSRINTSAVEEIAVISGGFDAEYGDALSGVINIVTREGGSKNSGRFSYLTDGVFPAQSMNYGYNLYEFSLGGPVTSRFHYFMSGEMLFTDAQELTYYQVPAPRFDYKAQGRLSYSFAKSKAKLTVSGFSSREQFMRWFPQNLKYFANNPMDRRKNWIGSATLTYMPSAKTLTTIKLGLTHYDRLQGTRDLFWEEEHDRKWYEDYRLKAEHLITEINHGRVPVKQAIIDSVMQYHTEYTNRDVDALRNNPYGVENMFYTYGDFRNWAYWANNDFQIRADLSHAVGKVHEFKTGLDFIRYDMQYYNNNLPWVTNPFWDYYDRQPYKISGYVQDKMDFEGLIARLGLRFDVFDPRAISWLNPNLIQDSALARPGINYKVSPRLGISLPVTDRMKFRFNYGHYFQIPRLNDMYTSTDTSVVRVALTRGNTIIGNIFIRPQKTVMYELGLENQLTQELIFGLTSYFKDIYDLSQIRVVNALPMAYFQYFNIDYGNVKGFDFSLRKVMSDYWSFDLNYTLQFAKGTASFAGQFYNNYYNSGTDPYTGLPLQPPQIDFWLDFDERSMINTDISVELPEDFVFIPLQRFAGTVVFSYHSGHPYTPQDLRGNNLGDQNSARMQGYWNVDLNASRQIPVGRVNLSLNLMVSNLFNAQQVVNIYPTTGRPDDHGDVEPSLSQFGSLELSSTRYSPQADCNHDGLLSVYEMKKAYMAALKDFYEDPTFYNEPLRIQVGVSLAF